jgi:hypothetical protein
MVLVLIALSLAWIKVKCPDLPSVGRFEAAYFVQSSISARQKRHQGWQTPCRVVFRKHDAGWKLVGVTRL